MWALMRTGLVFQSVGTGTLHAWTCSGQMLHMCSEIAAAFSCVSQ